MYNYRKKGNETMDYDSKNDILEHRKMVRENISLIINEIFDRGLKHDESKLHDPEKELFDIYTPKLKEVTYGSDEYKKYLKEIQVALDSHYSKNSHHPEHFDNGLSGMDLIDIIEMFCDWYAACKKHNDGNIYNSIKHNKDRFGYGEILESIFNNTAKMFDNK